MRGIGAALDPACDTSPLDFLEPMAMGLFERPEHRPGRSRRPFRDGGLVVRRLRVGQKATTSEPMMVRGGPICTKIGEV